jgi:hypothetical protein
MQLQNQLLCPVSQPTRDHRLRGQAAGGGQHCGLFSVVRNVVRAVVRPVVRTQHQTGRWAGLSASARQPGRSAGAVALWSSNDAVCCGRSQKNPHICCSIHPQPCAAAHSERSWAPRCFGLRSGPRRKLACERSAIAFPKRPAARTAPDHRPIRSLRSLMTRPVVRRAAREEKHRISRALGHSFGCRSLGLAPASAGTGSVSAGALPSPWSALGRPIPALRPWGGLRACLAGARATLAKIKAQTPRGLRALGHNHAGFAKPSRMAAAASSRPARSPSCDQHRFQSLPLFVQKGIQCHC